ncbi:MAG: phosphoribosylanthranilate isomerase [Marinilabiliaceae bacterium]|nr:phosphoribosylanthranilate isomerase [Marinilabiliaceae bacterium]
MIDLKIKVCGMRDKDNLLQLLELKPDFVGFIFYSPSLRYVGDNFSVEIPNLVKNAKKVGVFVNSSTSEVLEKMKKYRLDIAQLHGNETPEVCKTLQNEGFEVIKAFQADESFDFKILESYETVSNYFLFDTKSVKYGGSGKKFDWSLLKKYDSEKPFILSGGIGPDDAYAVEEINISSLYALDINSKFEISPSLKNIEWLTQFFKKLGRL